MESQTITGQKTRRGFNLIEAAIVLGVVGAIIGGIWVAASAVYENYKVNKTISDTITIIENLKKSFSISDGYRIPSNTDVTSAFLSMGGFPKDWSKNNSPKNPFGGNVKVQILNDTDWPRARVFYYGIPKSACIKLTVNISSLGSMTGTYKTGSIEERKSQPLISWFHNNVGTASQHSESILPITPDEARLYCSFDDNNIGYTSTLRRIN